MPTVEDILVVPTGEMLLAGHPTMHRTLPTAKNDLAENASSGVVENHGTKVGKFIIRRKTLVSVQPLGTYVTLAKCQPNALT